MITNSFKYFEEVNIYIKKKHSDLRSSYITSMIICNFIQSFLENNIGDCKRGKFSKDSELSLRSFLLFLIFEAGLIKLSLYPQFCQKLWKLFKLFVVL